MKYLKNCPHCMVTWQKDDTSTGTLIIMKVLGTNTMYYHCSACSARWDYNNNLLGIYPIQHE